MYARLKKKWARRNRRLREVDMREELKGRFSSG